MAEVKLEENSELMDIKEETQDFVEENSELRDIKKERQDFVEENSEFRDIKKETQDFVEENSELRDIKEETQDFVEENSEPMDIKEETQDFVEENSELRDIKEETQDFVEENSEPMDIKEEMQDSVPSNPSTRVVSPIWTSPPLTEREIYTLKPIKMAKTDCQGKGRLLPHFESEAEKDFVTPPPKISRGRQPLDEIRTGKLSRKSLPLMRKLKQGNNRNSSLAPSSLSHSIGQQTLNDDESTSAGGESTENQPLLKEHSSILDFAIGDVDDVIGADGVAPNYQDVSNTGSAFPELNEQISVHSNHEPTQDPRVNRVSPRHPHVAHEASTTKPMTHCYSMEAKGFYRERSSRVAKTLFPRNENSPRAVVKKRTPGKRWPASSLRQGKTAKRLVTKKAAAVSMSLVRDNKDRWMADIEQRLAVRTAELTAERARVSQLLAENEKLHADLSASRAETAASRAETDNLQQELQGLRETSQSGLLVQDLRAGLGQLQSTPIRPNTTHSTSVRPKPSHSTPVRPILRSASTPAPELECSDFQMSPLALSCSFNESLEIPLQRPDVSLRHFGPEDHARLHQQSFGQVGRYGCLLFRHIISEENYQAWTKTTNWDGSRGKLELPQNVKSFVLGTLKKHFPGMDRAELKECVDKINEFLRTTRRNAKGL